MIPLVVLVCICRMISYVEHLFITCWPFVCQVSAFLKQTKEGTIFFYWHIVNIPYPLSLHTSKWFDIFNFFFLFSLKRVQAGERDRGRIFFFNVYFERGRERVYMCTSQGRTEGEGETESWEKSMVSMVPNAELDVTTVRSWPEPKESSLTDWAT